VKYPPPDFLNGHVDIETYRKWLDRKALSLRKRDRNQKKSLTLPSKAEYKKSIHEVVCRSGGRDAYTGNQLDWRLISQYNNKKSQQGGREYWACFKKLPSIDHANGIPGKLDFEVCGLQTNDSKSWLNYKEFVEFCRQVVSHSENRRSKS
jgi:hypothetical protein